MFAIGAVAMGAAAFANAQQSPDPARGDATSPAPSADHSELVGDLPVPGIDAHAAAPAVDRLWHAYTEAEACLRRQGFGFVGPVAASDGSGVHYLVSAKAGGPTLSPSNACEDPLKSDAAAFARSASATARAELAADFTATAACLGLDGGPVIAEDQSPRDMDVEQEVMRRLMGSPADDDRCAGPRL